jgi:hypothetical protein
MAQELTSTRPGFETSYSDVGFESDSGPKNGDYAAALGLTERGGRTTKIPRSNLWPSNIARACHEIQRRVEQDLQAAPAPVSCAASIHHYSVRVRENRMFIEDLSASVSCTQDLLTSSSARRDCRFSIQPGSTVQTDTATRSVGWRRVGIDQTEQQSADARWGEVGDAKNENAGPPDELGRRRLSADTPADDSTRASERDIVEERSRDEEEEGDEYAVKHPHIVRYTTQCVPVPFPIPGHPSGRSRSGGCIQQSIPEYDLEGCTGVLSVSESFVRYKKKTSSEARVGHAFRRPLDEVSSVKLHRKRIQHFDVIEITFRNKTRNKDTFQFVRSIRTRVKSGTFWSV